MLQAVLREWRELVPGSRVTKVTQPASAVVVLSLRSRSWSGRLLISAEAGSPRAHATEAKFESPPRPPGFCQLLRRALTGRRAGSPRMVGGDRVVALPFAKHGPGGGEEEVTLVAELTGRQAALVLVEGPVPGGPITSAIGSGRRIKRLARGGAYSAPPWPEGARAPEDYTGETLAEALSAPALAGRPLYRRLVQSVMGLSPLAAREVCHRSGLELDAKEVCPEEARALLEAAGELFSSARDGTLAPVVYRDTAGRPVAATPVAFGHLETASRCEPTETANQAAASMAEAATESQRAVKLRHEVWAVVDRALKKTRRKMEKVRQDMERAQRSELERRYGELLLAHLNEVRQGTDSVTLPDDFEPERPPVTIPLDPAVTPQVNAARYFKKAKKGKRSHGSLQGRLEELEGESAYLEATRGAAALADEEAAEGLMEELSAAGFAPWVKKPAAERRPRRAVRTPAVRRFQAAEGWEVWVGKNARGNDELTTRIARSDDLWFHARGRPGAHVVLRGDRREEPPSEAVGWAAAAAAYFSRGRGELKVPVDYTQRKNVTKPKGARPGQVALKWKKTITVAPATPESLAEREVSAGGGD
jgi:predicted ribosome quality control (RQC) complex YloA/Tae2 family protein